MPSLFEYSALITGAGAAAGVFYVLYKEFIKNFLVVRRCDLDGPPSRGLLTGNVSDIAEKGELHLAVQEWGKKYGKVFKVRLINRLIVMAADPELLKLVLVQENFPKSAFYEKMTPILGRGILFLNGYEWKSRRKLMNPGFGHFSLKALVPVFLRNTEKFLHKMDGLTANGKEFEIDVSKEITSLTMDIIADGGFGYNLNAIEKSDNAAAEAFSLVLSIVAHPLFNLPGMNHFFHLLHWKKLRLIDRIVNSAIKKRMESGPSPKGAERDLLDLMLEAVDAETGRKLSSQELRDEVLIFFLAGHETTATTLTWMIYEVMRHPKVYEKLVAEIRSVVNNGDRIAFEDLNKLPYTTNVLKETLRLYPPVAISSRRVPHDVVYEGRTIPKNATVFVAPFIMQRDPEVWTNPDSFDPDRFDREEAQKASPFHFMPFTQGPRICIGQHFFWIEAKIILAMFLSRFDLKPVTNEIIEPTSNTGTLKPKKSVRARVVPSSSHEETVEWEGRESYVY